MNNQTWSHVYDSVAHLVTMQPRMNTSLWVGGFSLIHKSNYSLLCVFVCVLCVLFLHLQHYTSPVRLYCNSCHSFSISLGKKKLKHLWHVSLLWTLWIFIQKTRRWMLKFYRPLRMPRNINHHNVKYCH